MLTELPELTFINCFLLLIPILLWNLIFTPKLPEKYSVKDSERWIEITENIFRFACFGYTVFMPIYYDHTYFTMGIIIYISGMIIYFTAWIVIIKLPNKTINKYKLLYLGPAITPIIWLTGISIIGKSIIFFSISTLFIFVHVLNKNSLVRE